MKQRSDFTPTYVVKFYQLYYSLVTFLISCSIVLVITLPVPNFKWLSGVVMSRFILMSHYYSISKAYTNYATFLRTSNFQGPSIS